MKRKRKKLFSDTAKGVILFLIIKVLRFCKKRTKRTLPRDVMTWCAIKVQDYFFLIREVGFGAGPLFVPSLSFDVGHNCVAMLMMSANCAPNRLTGRPSSPNETTNHISATSSGKQAGDYTGRF